MNLFQSCAYLGVLRVLRITITITTITNLSISRENHKSKLGFKFIF